MNKQNSVVFFEQFQHFDEELLFSFAFSLIYFLFFALILTLRDFYSFWVVIECLIFVFIGICYRVINFGFIGLMLYFVIQAISSLNIFLFFMISFPTLLLFAILLKLSIFPFIFWYLPVFRKLPNFVLF